MSVAIDQEAPRASDGTRAGLLGMWIFIGSEVLLFGGLLFAYAAARSANGPAFALASRHTEILIGTANTALLLTSSAAVAVASGLASAHAWAAARKCLLFAIGLGAAFLLLKTLEYGLDWRHGLFPGPGFSIDMPAGERAGAQLFYTLYYLMTSLHALHMLAGLAMLSWMSWRMKRMPSEALAHSMEVTGLYWHFVDIVWIVLYPLLYLVDRS